MSMSNEEHESLLERFQKSCNDLRALRDSGKLSPSQHTNALQIVSNKLINHTELPDAVEFLEAATANPASVPELPMVMPALPNAAAVLQSQTVDQPANA